MDQPAALNSLPRELLLDIFSRFPVKTLCRLRSVCKRWLHLLTSDSEFTTTYHHIHKLNPLLLFTKNLPSEIDLISHYCMDGTPQSKFTTNFEGKVISILTCHGILCLVCSSKIFLCDPITKRSFSLSSSYFRSTVSIAFGYAPLRDEFKIIHFYEVEKFDNYHYGAVRESVCQILSRSSRDLWSQNSSTSSSSSVDWKFMGKCQFDVLSRKSNVYVDGFIYWFIAEKKFNPECIRILSFDVEKENFGVVCFPRIYSNRSVECMGLLEMKETLCLIDRLPWETIMDIWMLEDGHKGLWNKKHSIDLVRIDHHNVKILGYVSSLQGHNEGEILMKIGSQSLVYYDMEKNEFRTMNIDDGDEAGSQEYELQLLVKRNYLV